MLIIKRKFLKNLINGIFKYYDNFLIKINLNYKKNSFFQKHFNITLSK
jgi:hypothetical protein